MKKILFLTATALGIASQAFALNPTNSFYVPKKGNFLFRGDASWKRIQDKTGTDTAIMSTKERKTVNNLFILTIPPFPI